MQITISARTARLFLALILASVVTVLSAAVAILATWPVSVTLPAAIGAVVVGGVLFVVGRPRI